MVVNALLEWGPDWEANSAWLAGSRAAPFNFCQKIFQDVLHANLLVFLTNLEDLMLGSQIFQLNSSTFFDVML